MLRQELDMMSVFRRANRVKDSSRGTGGGSELRDRNNLPAERMLRANPMAQSLNTTK